MVSGIDRFLAAETERSVAQRALYWRRDFASREAYDKSVTPNRQRLAKAIGAVDPRQLVPALELIGTTNSPALVAETETFTVTAVRWPVLEGVTGEGLWLQPKRAPVARVIALPDADQTPEQVAGLTPDLAPERQFARRLAEQGCAVLVPVLIGRQDTWSGNERLQRFTNQPHREWIYRQAFELGRHIIGYEVQKVLAAVDWFSRENESGAQTKIGVAGFGEGGLIALHAAALDPRLDSALVGGYFDSRQHLADEPIYRNVFGLLREFGDAELASLVAPRALIIEHSPAPEQNGPPPPRAGRSGAAPGKLSTPDYLSVETEFERVRTLLRGAKARDFDHTTLITGTEGLPTGPMSDRALIAFLQASGLDQEELRPPGPAPADLRAAYDPAERQERQLRELEEFTQTLLRRSESVRDDFFWKKVQATPVSEWTNATLRFRKILEEEVIGRWPGPAGPLNPRTRRLPEHPKWIGYEVMLDVNPGVFAWGYLLLPKDLPPGERRAVVVCQHGLEGTPADVINENTNSQAFRYYQAFASRLAGSGYVVFAPHNPYRGEDRFRRLQRLANPLGLSLFSVIIEQHRRLLDWLSTQPFVDPQRISFYGLSYGGKTAMRVPAVLDGYALSICSADFNDWIRKNAATDSLLSYMFTGEYEMPEFNLGNTFNYAEMAALIAPRPFMVERGHQDGVGIDEWVASEYAKVKRLYDRLEIGDRTAIEFFDGGHTINGVGTFEFLKRQLGQKR
jgi:dienelactone hydrolase